MCSWLERVCTYSSLSNFAKQQQLRRHRQSYKNDQRYFLMKGTKQGIVVLSFAILVTGLAAIGSGFFPALAATTTTPSAPPVNLKTDNGSVGIVVDWSPKEI